MEYKKAVNYVAFTKVPLEVQIDVDAMNGIEIDAIEKAIEEGLELVRNDEETIKCMKRCDLASRLSRTPLGPVALFFVHTSGLPNSTPVASELLNIIESVLARRGVPMNAAIQNKAGDTGITIAALVDPENIRNFL